MAIIVFCGPTISPEKAQTQLSAEYRPPAKQGDIYLATLAGPKVIVLIDGYFASVPSVWHKEVLYAMSQGIHVYGCSSMGALRAAELEHFGMNGFGEVYRQYATEQLEDDDEVAVSHAPAELGFASISDAMVNIRASLAKALAMGVIDQARHQRLMTFAKSQHFSQRSYSGLLDFAKTEFSAKDYAAFELFLSEHQIDIKQQDALGLLQHLNRLDIKNLPKKQVDYQFAHTDAWSQLVTHADARYLSSTCQVPIAKIKAQLQAKGELDALMAQARARHIQLQKAARHHTPIDAERFQQTLIDFAQSQGFIEQGQIQFAQLNHWLERQDMTIADFDRLMKAQYQLASLNIPADCDQALIDILRLSGQYEVITKTLYK